MAFGLFLGHRFAQVKNQPAVLPNERTEAIPDAELFQAFARICLHLGKIPTNILFRKLTTRTLQKTIWQVALNTSYERWTPQFTMQTKKQFQAS